MSLLHSFYRIADILTSRLTRHLRLEHPTVITKNTVNRTDGVVGLTKIELTTISPPNKKQRIFPSIITSTAVPSTAASINKEQEIIKVT